MASQRTLPIPLLTKHWRYESSLAKGSSTPRPLSQPSKEAPLHLAQAFAALLHQARPAADVAQPAFPLAAAFAAAQMGCLSAVQGLPRLEPEPAAAVVAAVAVAVAALAATAAASPPLTAGLSLPQSSGLAHRRRPRRRWLAPM